MKRRLLALLLILLFVLPLAAACGNANQTTAPQSTETKKPDSGNQPSGSDESETEEGDVWYEPERPAGLTTQDKEFVFLCFTDDSSFYWHDSDFLADSINGDTMNDAVFQRNKYVEEELGITLTIVPGDAQLGTSTLSNSISAGDDEFQAADLTTHDMFSLAGQELLLELNSMGTIQLTSPWWDQHCLEDLSILNQNFGLYGEIGSMYKRTLGCVIFNKPLFHERFPDVDLYEEQAEKRWTIEAMTDIVLSVSEDLDGDQTMTEADLFGMTYQGDMLPIALIACDIRFVTKDEDDIPELTLNDEKTIEAIDYLGDLMYDTDCARSSSANQPKVNDHHDCFKNAHSVFDVTEIHAVIDMRSMDQDFGVLCMPLYDESQENYLTCINPHVAATLVVPNSIKEPEFVGFVLDYLSAAGMNYMTPAFYDITLQSRSVRDQESKETIDIISSSVRYDIGYLSDWGMSASIRSLADTRSKNFSSRWASDSSSFESKMEQTIEAFERLRS